MSSILKIDWATHEAAKYACENWHYSKSLPVGKLVKVGVWENGNFIGVVIFGRGANFRIGEPYGLQQTECIELVRVALKTHASPVSKILALALKWVKKQSQKIRLIVSYADSEQGHHGGIYQAANWIYSGRSLGSEKVFYKGKWVHKRTVDSILGHHRGFPVKKTQGKHTYLMPLDAEIKRRILPLRKPYPKRAESIVVDAPTIQAGEGGAEPTSALHSE
jgi:hypothetical protein